MISTLIEGCSIDLVHERLVFQSLGDVQFVSPPSLRSLVARSAKASFPFFCKTSLLIFKLVALCVAPNCAIDNLERGSESRKQAVQILCQRFLLVESIMLSLIKALQRSKIQTIPASSF
jgi:hypothetical protein